MHDYERVRQLYYRDGLGKREISKLTGFHRITINKMLRYSAPLPYKLKQARPKNKLGPFISIIDEILERDKLAPKKQRHTAKRIMDRLKAEYGYTGSYTIVKDYVRDRKTYIKEVFFPLEQRPGTSQSDFIEARAILGGKEQDVKVFCMGLAFSDGIYTKAYQTEALEAVQDGHVGAYEFFGGVPPTGLYDNPKTIVKSVLKNRYRDLTDGFIALRSHYLFKSHFCNVRRANEKGVVEGAGGYVRRNWFVPMPNLPDMESLNAYLLGKCRERLTMKAARKEKTIGELLEEERSVFLPLPAVPFEACRVECGSVRSLSLVRFQDNDYSVPVEYAYREVTVKAYVNRVKICHKDIVIAEHKRSYEKNDIIFEAVHYLLLLERKPGALDGALPFVGWKLPECFELLRRDLEARNGNAGKKEYILVLQLLRDFTVSEVRCAIEKALFCRSVKFESVKMFLLAAREPEIEAVRLSEEIVEALPKVSVGKTDFSKYSALIAGGEI